MGRVVLACKNDEERKMATCPVFAPYPIHTDRQAESVRHCVGFRSGITVQHYHQRFIITRHITYENKIITFLKLNEFDQLYNKKKTSTILLKNI